jgi:hypothetical protein
MELIWVVDLGVVTFLSMDCHVIVICPYQTLMLPHTYFVLYFRYCSQQLYRPSRICLLLFRATGKCPTQNQTTRHHYAISLATLWILAMGTRRDKVRNCIFISLLMASKDSATGSWVGIN